MIGETIGNFKIVSRLGRGGMGEVWLAEQQSIGTKVAIKLLNADISEDTEHVQRFFNEARAVSRIQHAGIVKIFDVGHHAGHAYLIMEYLEGETLGKRIAATRRLSLGDLSEIGRQVASVLDATHSAGITHRDLKPDNIYIVPDRELSRGYRVKVLDFGIAKLTGTLAVVSPRTTGTMGTPAYMAPEQWGDASKVDWRADLYSLGCVAFEMATGRPPFIVTNIAEACAKHLNDPPPRLREVMPDLPPALDALVDRLLSKSPGARAASMREVERAFASMPRSEAISLAETIGATGGAATGATTDGRISATVLDTVKTRSRFPRVMLAAVAAVVLVFGSLVAIKKLQRRSIVVVTPRSEPVVEPIAQAAPADAAAPDAAPLAAEVLPIDAGVAAGIVKKSTGQPVRDAHPDSTKEGKIDADAVFNLAKGDAGLRTCYLTELSKDITLQGKVTAMVTVDPRGRVTASSATGVSPAVSSCIARHLKQLKFPPVTGGDYAIVYLPLTYHPPDLTNGTVSQLTATTSGAPVLRNTPTQAELNAGMKTVQPFVDACDKLGEGSGSVEVSINPDGSVSQSKVLGALAGSAVASCIENAIMNHGAFAASKNGVHATARFSVTKP